MHRNRLKRLLRNIITLGENGLRRKRRYNAIIFKRKKRNGTHEQPPSPGRRNAFARWAGVGGAAVVGLGAGYSPDAYAISSAAIAKIVVERMKAMLSDLYNQYMQGFFTQFDNQTDKQVGAIGATGDAIMTRDSEIHNSNVARASEPQADPCRAKDRGTHGMAAMEATRVGVAKDDAKISYAYTSMDPEDYSVNSLRRYRWRLKEFGVNGNNPGGDTTASFLSSTQINEEEQKASMSFVDNVLGESRSMTFPPVGAQVNSETAEYEQRRSSLAARRSLIQRALLNPVHRRKGGEDGKPSEADAMHSAVNETWGSPDYRDQVNSAADAAPVLKSMVDLLATQNAMLLCTQDMTEMSNQLLSVIALELMEEPEKRKELSDLYVKASTGYNRDLN